MPSQKYKIISISLPETLLKILDERRKKVSRSAYICNVLATALDLRIEVEE